MGTYELYCTCGDSGLNDAATQKMALGATEEGWSTEEARDVAEDDEEDEENRVRRLYTAQPQGSILGMKTSLHVMIGVNSKYSMFDLDSSKHQVRFLTVLAILVLTPL